MSAVTLEPTVSTHKAVIRNWGAPIAMAVLALIALLVFGIRNPGTTASFGISNANDAIQLPALNVNTALWGWIFSIILVALAAYALYTTAKKGIISSWVGWGFAFVFVAAFLVWVIGSANTTSVFLTGLIAGSFTLAVPLIFGSLSGVLGERAGIVNIAIEGQLLAGAFAAAVGSSITGSPWVGLICAMAAGLLVGLVLAVFAIKYVVDQIIVGVVLNVLVTGLTSFLFSQVLADNAETFNSPVHFETIRIPVLADIPIFGNILFNQTIVGYLMYVAVIGIWYALFKTKWGLRVRAVGEHPTAADTVGINVNRTRYLNTMYGGAVAGLGGAFFTLVSSGSFSKEMTAGQGFIALAALIFGRWNPIGAFFAALLFGFATNLQFVLSILGTPVPSQFLIMLPYVVTIVAVAGLVGKSRGPAAAGVAYVKG
ncbi:ABC transporter permease [Neomicrococcus aestuarii]|uniref:ABC transporter permease n=1 Tax=Neomicrococcus aestuarii TaxID=556325 RepID=A0A1L2ZND8_9MICC|nr:ABC transporter permease [Neomicrococcus aestuarii]APF40548.1 ABC transporter permease [Neomicrococcus aestuarii]MBB5512227.1 simple sugar transport system permease protein [Neomicrococcus aestuarii]